MYEKTKYFESQGLYATSHMPTYPGKINHGIISWPYMWYIGKVYIESLVI